MLYLVIERNVPGLMFLFFFFWLEVFFFCFVLFFDVSYMSLLIGVENVLDIQVSG